MARYAKAAWKPLSRNYTKRVSTKNCVILHSAASNGSSLKGWFDNPRASASSHFYVRKDGVVEQYVDTAYISWANMAANSRSVTIETAGCAPGAANEPWTTAQFNALVGLVKWICETHGIPKTQMDNSKASEKGIGWHRLGCDGNFPRTGILRGRTQRGVGEKWSAARGKVCPGDRRIKQIPSLIEKVNAKTSGTASKPSTSKPTVKPKPKAWPYIPTTAGNRTKAWDELLKRVGYAGKTVERRQKWLKKLGYYPDPLKIDNKWGYYTAKAQQEFLKAKGLYKGRITGKVDTATKNAEVAYLEAQRKIILKKEGVK